MRGRLRTEAGQVTRAKAAAMSATERASGARAFRAASASVLINLLWGLRHWRARSSLTMQGERER